MGNSSSTTIRAAAITASAVAATATVAWGFCSYYLSEKAESQNKSSEAKELQTRLLVSMEGLDFSHAGVNIGDSPIYDPETTASLSGNEVLINQHIIQGSEIHRTTDTQLDRIQASKAKDVRYHFESKESCKQKEVEHDRNTWRSKAEQKLKADASNQIPKHLTPNSYNRLENSERHSTIQFDKSYEDTGVQAESSQVGSKKLTPLSLKKYRRQKNKQSDIQKPQKLRRKRKPRVDGNNPISRHVTRKIHLQGNEVRVDQHIIQGSEIRHTTHTQLDHIQASKVKDARYHFESKESCKLKVEVDGRRSQKLKAKHKLMANANKQIPENSERHSKIPFEKSYEDIEVQDDSSQVGSKKVTPLSLKKYRRQKNKPSDNQNSRKLKRKRKLKVDGDNQISRHLAPKIHLQETIKIMSYNIWSIKHYKREKRMNAVNHLIEQHSPDIILLQEVTPEVYIYFQSCNWWDVYKCSIEGKQATKQVFCMMLSKLPVKKFFYKQFANTKTCKGVSAAKLTSNPKKALTVATCHLKSPDGACAYDVERTSQAKEAIDLLKFSPNVVLGGDMNWDESTDGPFPLISGWCDAWSGLKPEEDGYTYDTESNAMLQGRRFVVQKRLDRFVCRLKDFYMTDIEIVGTEAIKGVSCKSNGKKLPLLPSDHYGLILTICAK